MTRYNVEAIPPLTFSEVFQHWDLLFGILLALSSPLPFSNTTDPLNDSSYYSGFCATKVSILFILEISPIIPVVHLPTIDPPVF